MSREILAVVVIVAILCFTGLIAQCSHRLGNCQVESIKAGKSAEDIARLCK